MSFTPQQVGRMSLYQFAACVDGFNRANRADGGAQAPTDDEFRAALAAHHELLAA